MPTWLLWAIGGVAVFAWGTYIAHLLLEERWIFNSVQVFAFSDLAERYHDAHILLVHGDLYDNRGEAFSYPPIVGYLFVPSHAIGFKSTAIVVTIVTMFSTAMLFALSLERFMLVPLARAWFVSAVVLAPLAVFALYPYHDVVLEGQLGAILLLMVFVDLFVVPKRHRGYLIGIATAIKLVPGIFIFWLLVKREISGVARALTAFLVVTIVAWILWPHGSTEFWFHILPSPQSIGRINSRATSDYGSYWYGGLGSPDNQSLLGLLSRPPFLRPGVFPWLPLALALLAGGVWVTARLIRQSRELAGFCVLALTMVLVSPVSWLHYWVFVGLLPAVAWLEWRRDRPLALGAIALVLVTCVNLDAQFFPLRQPHAWPAASLFILRNLYVLGGLIFLAIAVLRASRADQSRSVDLLPAAA